MKEKITANHIRSIKVSYMIGFYRVSISLILSLVFLIKKKKYKTKNL